MKAISTAHVRGAVLPAEVIWMHTLVERGGVGHTSAKPANRRLCNPAAVALTGWSQLILH
jgi:hypothetical protein